MITIYDSAGYFVKYDSLTFSDGAAHIRLKPYQHNLSSAKIVAHLRSSHDVMELLMATDALRRMGYKDISLICPYFPYARQDRVCSPGEALGARVMADLINSQGYTSVEVWDVHSDVTGALLNNCVNIPQHHFTLFGLSRRDYTVLAPDAGAVKKAFETAHGLSAPFMTAEKHRDTKTGKISGVSLNTRNLPCMVGNILIVDDICDGGRTFIELAKVVKRYTSRPICLYVTHGIFSKGLDVLKPYIDHVYCANIWPDKYQGNESYITILRKD